jgi:hypothetical protein
MGYKAAMKHASAALALSFGLLGLLPLTGCSKIKAALGKGDAGEDTASSGGLLGGKTGGLAFLNGFEGEIDVLAKGQPGGAHGAAKPAAPSPDLHVAVLMKTGKIRVDVPPGLAGTEKLGHVYGIFDSGQKKAYAVMDAQKQAIMIDLNKTGEHLQNASHTTGGPAAPSKPPPKVTKTGKTDTVAGYTCEIWDIADDTNHATMCIAEEGFSIFHIPLTGAPAEYAWMAELMDGKHIPLRLITFDKAGAEEGRIEITKIDKKTEPAASFEVPAGYKIVDLGEMFKAGVAGAGGPPAGFSAHGPPHR